MRAWLVLLVVLALPARALAWVEWHHQGDDVRLTLGKDGRILVETTSKYDIARGPIKTFDVQGIDADAQVEPDLHVERIANAPLAGSQPVAPPEALSQYSGHIEPLPKRPDAAFEGQAVRFVLDGAPLGGTSRNGAVVFSKAKAGLPRGAYAITWRYRIDATKSSHWLTREGSKLRLLFQGTSAPEGYDSARLVVVVPAAPDPPRLSVSPWGASVAAVRRGPGEDEIELIRPHVARAEAPKFLVDLDPRTLPLVDKPELRPVLPAPPAPRTWQHVSWALLALGFGAIVFVLARLAPRRSLVPVPERAAVVALLAAVGVGVEAVFGFEWSLWLAPLLLLLALTPSAARAPTGASWEACELPAPTSLPRWLLVRSLVVLPFVFVPLAAALDGPLAGASMLVRAAALLPLSVAAWPEHGERRMLAVARKLIARGSGLVQITCARHVETEERRLLVQPTHPLPGFVGMELGRSRAGIASLVRVEKDSPAERRLRTLWPRAVGREGRPGEILYRLFAPTTRAVTLRRILELVAPAFGERRVQQAHVSHERRTAALALAPASTL